MENVNIVCIGCPLGCPLVVSVKPDGIDVKGHSCKIGKTYAEKEITNPTRVVTSSVSITGGFIARLPVKTASDIPKNTIFKCMEEIHKVCVNAPVKVGDVIIENCAGTGVDVIATRNVAAK